MALTIKNLATATIILVIVIGGFFLFQSDSNDDSNLNENSVNSDADIPVIDDIVPGEVEESEEIGKSTFIHPQYGFSLNFPSDMKNTNFAEGGGEQILFQDDAEDKWFQIYVTPWDEGDNLSVVRIKQDLPNLLIENPQDVILGPKQKDGVGPRATIFFSEQDGLGKTREVWFVRDRFLYQITTFRKLDTFLAEILSTLVFN